MDFKSMDFSISFSNISNYGICIFDPQPELCMNESRSFPNFPNSSVGHSRFDRYRIFLDIYVVGFLCVVGFIGNALTICVLWRTKDKSSSTNWLLQTLAVVDTLYLISCLFVQLLKAICHLTDWIPGLRDQFPYMEPYVWPLASIAQTMTVWVVVLVTVDRYVAVCRPFNTQLRSRRRVKIVVILVELAAILYNLPLFFEREIQTEQVDGATVVRATTTSLRDSQLYFVAYKIVCYLIFRTAGPLIVLVVLNVLLIRGLRKTRVRQRSLSSKLGSNQQRESITLMLVVVVSIFIICQLPDVTLRLAINQTMFIPSLALDRDFYRFINAITNAMLTLNSSVNFLVYCLVGKKFRRIFIQMIFGGRCNGSIKATSGVEFNESATATGGAGARCNAGERKISVISARQIETRITSD